MTIHGSVRGPDRHPPLEEVAAFVDGRLAGEERRRMVEHLAHCDDCHELMSETVLLLRESAEAGAEQDGGESPAEDAEAHTTPGRILRPPPGRFRRALPLAAAVAAAAVVALLVWTPAGDRVLRRSEQPLAVASLTADLPTGDRALTAALRRFDEHGWPITRGADPVLSEEQAASFQAGVRVAEMQAALAAEDRDTANLLTYRIEDLLDSLDASLLIPNFAGPGSIREGLSAHLPTSELLHLNVEADGLLAPDADYPGFVDGTFYTLGKWAGAAQLAVAAGRLDWFDEPGPRRALRQLRRADLSSDVAEPFSAITAILDAGPAATDLPRLREAFETLIRRAGGGRDPAP